MSTISNRIDKPKLTAVNLVKKLEEEKGIVFIEMDKRDAVLHLLESNNYLRTASYRINYAKNKDGKYVNLDYAYLVELSKIDMYLRSYLLKMSVDFEHALKVNLLSKIESNDKENGYDIVDAFLDKYPFVKQNLAKKSTAVFTGDLINKYFTLTPNGNMFEIVTCDCPIWVLVEIISFGELIKLYNFYYERNPSEVTKRLPANVLNIVLSLRNACAHNNCILRDLHECDKTYSPAIISKFVANNIPVGKSQRSRKLASRPILEIVSLMYCYIELVPKTIAIPELKKFQQFANERLVRNIYYFEKNQLVYTSLQFIQKSIDNLVENAYNT